MLPDAFKHILTYISLEWRQQSTVMPFEQIRSVTACVSGGPGRPFNSSSDLFEESDDILAHVRQTDNDVVVVDVAERGVVSALPPGLLQDQIPAVHSGHEVLVLSARAKGRK